VSNATAQKKKNAGERCKKNKGKSRNKKGKSRRLGESVSHKRIVGYRVIECCKYHS